MDKAKTLKQIWALHDQAAALAAQLIEAEARKILQRHTRLHEFCMSMGTHMFIDKNGDVVYDELKYLQVFADMLNALDDTFKVSGCPMRFTADGAINTEW